MIELHAGAKDRVERLARESPELRDETERFRQRNGGIGKLILLARELWRQLDISY